MAFSAYHYYYGYDLDLESIFFMSNDDLFERIIYIVYVFNGV